MTFTLKLVALTNVYLLQSEGFDQYAALGQAQTNIWEDLWN